MKQYIRYEADVFPPSGFDYPFGDPRTEPVTDTPPRAEMPKPDMLLYPGDKIELIPPVDPFRAWRVNHDDNTTSIERAYSELERYAQQQCERAEKAEAAKTAALVTLDAEVTERMKLQAKNERLRELLEGIPAELREWWSFDQHQFHTHSYHSREDYIDRLRKRINAALHPTNNDEQEGMKDE